MPPAVEQLILLLYRRSAEEVDLGLLPDELCSVDVVTAARGLGLIQFGNPSHGWSGGQLSVSRSWTTQWESAAAFIAAAKQHSGTNTNILLRLTGEGSGAAARLSLAGPPDEELREAIEQELRKHAGPFANLLSWMRERWPDLSVGQLRLAIRALSDQGRIEAEEYHGSHYYRIALTHMEGIVAEDPDFRIWPDWLKSIAVRVDELLANPATFERFRAMVRGWKEQHDVRGAGQKHNRVELLPLRRLPLEHCYVLLGALHDEICKRSQEINPWPAPDDPAGFSYVALRNQVEGIRDLDRRRVEGALEEVLGDLVLPEKLVSTTARASVEDVSERAAARGMLDGVALEADELVRQPGVLDRFRGEIEEYETQEVTPAAGEGIEPELLAAVSKANTTVQPDVIDPSALAQAELEAREEANERFRRELIANEPPLFFATLAGAYAVVTAVHDDYVRTGRITPSAPGAPTFDALIANATKWASVIKLTLSVREVVTRRQALAAVHALDEVKRDLASVAASFESRAPLDVWDALTKRQRECLSALSELGAFSTASLVRADDVARRAEGDFANADGFKKPLADLKKRGLVDSKGGREGGYWLTPVGRTLTDSHDSPH